MGPGVPNGASGRRSESQTRKRMPPGISLTRVKEFVDVAKSKGEGWVPYMWPKPGAEAPVKKLTYVYRVPGKNVFVGAGIYE